MAVFDRS